MTQPDILIVSLKKGILSIGKINFVKSHILKVVEF